MKIKEHLHLMVTAQGKWETMSAAGIVVERWMEMRTFGAPLFEGLFRLRSIGLMSESG